ncbi:hypothetical protein ANN_14843 [Periplaneta americana]|uniref:Uncharacterized protein n=1 Tax=Periplaneta americana TaxID=6978 RepID=A0ABQ8SYI2_PERAM|nr:hypothetical protein ANN_14843 [Periplaneta americana]
MSPGSSTESYPAFALIGLRENPGKNLNQDFTLFKHENQRSGSEVVIGMVIAMHSSFTTSENEACKFSDRRNCVTDISELLSLIQHSVNDGRVLMFATDRNLELLAASDTIFSDDPSDGLLFTKESKLFRNESWDKRSKERKRRNSSQEASFGIELTLDGNFIRQANGVIAGTTTMCNNYFVTSSYRNINCHLTDCSVLTYKAKSEVRFAK